jgi:isocitrate dehydrogenase (NAD+)
MFAFRRFSSCRITLFPGEGIGPEITDSVISVLDAAQAPVSWETFSLANRDSTSTKTLLNPEGMASLKTTKVGLKGPFTTAVGAGAVSVNVLLRRELQMYANVRPAVSIQGLNSRYHDVDIVTIRENTEGEYSGKEHEVIPGVIENLKIISEKACDRIALYAFNYARNCSRTKVTALHKATIMKLGDGLFLKSCRKAAKEFPEINYEERSVDTACGLLATRPELFDVMVMPNLYGDIVSDLCSGLVGGLGLTPSGNIGSDVALFEAVHGSAPDIAGKNKANPSALLFSTVMLLRHMELHEVAERVNRAVQSTLATGLTLTGDLGGQATTTGFTKAVIQAL